MNARWLGRVGYSEAAEAQRAHRDALIAGTADEELWLLEHDPVITTGRRDAGVDREMITAAGYSLVETERGGLATCHEPGQLVGYLLADARLAGVRRTIDAIEAALTEWLGSVGVEAHVREGFPGVWVGDGKVAAIGMHFKQGRTMHGFAVNLTNDRRGFSLITPCGIPGGRVVTLADFGPRIEPREAAESVGRSVVAAFLDARGGGK